MMGKVLLARGAQGELVLRVQARLEERGFSPQGIDGDFGGKTETALRDFQEANDLGSSGHVNLTTWDQLMEADRPTVAERALLVTAAFEGHGFRDVVGNFDGAGITWGIIGFTLLHGSLRRVIEQVQAASPDLVQTAFGNDAQRLLEVLTAPRQQRLAFADSISLGSSKSGVRQPWRRAFETFGSFLEVQQAQLAVADEDYFQPARLTAEELGLHTELGIALAFDAQVQNGGVKARAREKIERDLARHSTELEQEVRVIVANAVADASLAQFREDVRSRKLTLAAGAGRVHGATYVLRNWGLDETAAAD